MVDGAKARMNIRSESSNNVSRENHRAAATPVAVCAFVRLRDVIFHAGCSGTTSDALAPPLSRKEKRKVAQWWFDPVDGEEKGDAGRGYGGVQTKSKTSNIHHYKRIMNFVAAPTS